jgi:hypothetical protein
MATTMEGKTAKATATVAMVGTTATEMESVMAMGNTTATPQWQRQWQWKV